MLASEWRGNRPARAVSKLIASAAFVVVGALGLATPHDAAQDGFARLVALGLVLGALGDAALLARAERWFLAGLGAFLLGHLAYVAAVAAIVPLASWPTLAGPSAAVPVLGGVVALAVLWPRLGALRVPVVAYVGVIVAMVVAALAFARGAPVPSSGRTRFVVGALLFFVSDLAVARDRFVGESVVNKAWGLPTYFGGQLLIAWAVA
jgi:uncharacterized membrane protein YhhN